MDVGNPISTVVPSLDGPVLQVLARTTNPLSGREVHRLAGTGSVAGVRKVLQRLTRQGLVHADERAQAVYYTVNRDHLAWPAVELLTSLRAELLSRLRADFASWLPEPMHASLFGSTARSDGDTESDVDVLIVRPDDVHEDESRWAEQVDTLVADVTKWTGNRCHAFQVDRARLREHVRKRDRLIAELLDDGITLAGPDLSAIIRELPRGKK